MLSNLVKAKCDFCKNKLSEHPASVVVDNHEFKVCAECERLLETINERIKQEIDKYYEPLNEPF